nr:MAG TPA: hypothetical protein [Podoviridae sp. ctgHy19]
MKIFKTCDFSVKSRRITERIRSCSLRETLGSIFFENFQNL